MFDEIHDLMDWETDYFPDAGNRPILSAQPFA